MQSGTSTTCAVAFSAALCAISSATAQTQLPETLVTATRFPQSATAAPYAVGVITAEQIKAIGASSVNEAIMKLLGVPGRLDTAGGGNYSLDLRGFG